MRPGGAQKLRGAQALRLWVAMALLYVGAGSVNPLLSLYMSQRGLSDVEIGLLASAASVSSIAAALASGRASDAVERRDPLQADLCLGTALLAAAFTLARGFAGFAVVYPAYAALSFSSMSVAAAVAMERAGARGGGFGAMRASGAAGWVVGTLAGGLLSQSVGFHAAFALASAAFAASALLYGPGLPRASRRPAGGREPLSALRGGRPLATLLAILVASVANPAYYTFLPLYIVQGLGAPKLTASIAFSVTPFAEIPAMVALGSLSDRVGRRKVIAACLAAYPLRFGLTGLLSDPALVVGVQLLHGLTFGGLYVAATAYFTEELRGAAGTAAGLYPLASGLGGMLGGYLLALVLASRGFRAMYAAAAAVSALSLPVLFAPELGAALRRRRPTQRPLQPLREHVENVG